MLDNDDDDDDNDDDDNNNNNDNIIMMILRHFLHFLFLIYKGLSVKESFLFMMEQDSCIMKDTTQ